MDTLLSGAALAYFWFRSQNRQSGGASVASPQVASPPRKPQSGYAIFTKGHDQTTKSETTMVQVCEIPIESILQLVPIASPQQLGKVKNHIKTGNLVSSMVETIQWHISQPYGLSDYLLFTRMRPSKKRAYERTTVFKRTFAKDVIAAAKVVIEKHKNTGRKTVDPKGKTSDVVVQDFSTHVKVIVMGDIHCNVLSVVHLLKQHPPGPNTAWVFTGDFMDRGLYGVETLLLVLALKLEHPNDVFMLRGNHELIKHNKNMQLSKDKDPLRWDDVEFNWNAWHPGFGELDHDLGGKKHKEVMGLCAKLPVAMKAALPGKKVGLFFHGAVPLKYKGELESYVADDNNPDPFLWGDFYSQTPDDWNKRGTGIRPVEPDSYDKFMAFHKIDITVSGHQHYYGIQSMRTHGALRNSTNELEKTDALYLVAPMSHSEPVKLGTTDHYVVSMAHSLIDAALEDDQIDEWLKTNDSEIAKDLGIR